MAEYTVKLTERQERTLYQWRTHGAGRIVPHDSIYLPDVIAAQVADQIPEPKRYIQVGMKLAGGDTVRYVSAQTVVSATPEGTEVIYRKDALPRGSLYVTTGDPVYFPEA